MLVRRIARPLFATWFVTEGLDVLRRPGPHADRAEPVVSRLSSAAGRPGALQRGQLGTLVRVHGAAMTIAGVLLALGRAPRTAAMALAALTVPLVVVNQPFGSLARTSAAADGSGGTEDDDTRSRFSRPVGATGGVSTRSVPAGGSDHRAQQERWLRNLSMLGGALLAGIDAEGRPGVVWRVKHARVDAAREARHAVATATRSARHATREARRLAS